MLPKRNCYLFCKNFLVAFCILLAFISVIYSFRHYFRSDSSSDVNHQPRIKDDLALVIENNEGRNLSVPGNRLTFNSEQSSSNTRVLDKVHIFYYPWYVH